MTPNLGGCCSLRYPLATPLSRRCTLEGIFELTRRPSRALHLPRVLLLELQRNNYTVRCVALGVEVPGDHHEQLAKTSIVHLLKTQH